MAYRKTIEVVLAQQKKTQLKLNGKDYQKLVYSMKRISHLLRLGNTRLIELQRVK